MKRAILLAACLICSVAQAHGALPQTLSLKQWPGADPGRLASATTFGLLVRNTEASSWRWVCEESIGYGQTQRPVLYAAPGGELWVASLDGLSVSRDNGCTWTVLPQFSTTGVATVTGLTSDPNVLYVGTARYGSVNQVLKSTDRGVTLNPTSLSSDKRFYSTIVPAPSQPTRVYVGGWWFDPTSTAYLYVSDDAGLTYTETEITNKLPGKGPFSVHAVHPARPQVFWASVSTSDEPANHVLLTEDSGATFVTVLSTDDGINGVEVSPDGQTVWVATTKLLYRSNDSGHTFTALPSPSQNACVSLIGNQLYSCGWPAIDRWSVASSTDQGDTFTPRLHWTQVESVLDCPADSQVTIKCNEVWPTVQAQLASLDPIGFEPEDAGADTPTPTPKHCGCDASDTSPVLVGAVLSFLRAWAHRHQRKQAQS